jgi:hypothetical protein
MGAELSTPSAAEQVQTTSITPETNTITPEDAAPIFERYVEPPGTKVEVDPTEVLESADVIKKAAPNKKVKEESKAK